MSWNAQCVSIQCILKGMLSLLFFQERDILPVVSRAFLALVLASALAVSGSAEPQIPSTLEQGFESPPKHSRPETWFHLIGGNVDREALTKDLEAVASARIGGIQLFHGRGRPWPGVQPQVQTLSETWDSLLSHTADEAERLGLKFTMQNCPGWAMSGGPWISPDKAMRHLIYSRVNVTGGQPMTINLAKPEPSREEWRDYRDIAVVAFPTVADDSGLPLVPDRITSNLPNADWKGIVDGTDVEIQVPAVSNASGGSSSTWVEFEFDQPVTLRSIQLPPIELLMKRVSFSPDSSIIIAAFEEDRWNDLVTHVVPRGNWQDRQPEVHFVLSIPDVKSNRYRMTFHNGQPMEISHLKLSSTAKLHDWRAQAGYALRSLERTRPPEQTSSAWLRLEDVIDLTEKVDQTGELAWDAPEGDWTVVRFGHVNTGVTNKPAPPEATGFECDKLSAAGAEQHFAGYIGRVSKPGGPADNGRLQGMLIDSWECYTQTWTPAMEFEFKGRRGYALRKWLPALAGWVVQDHRTSERFLRDWRATISDLIVDNYYGRLAELGKERGLELSFETAVGDVSPGDILQYFKYADIPMCEVWKPNDPHEGGLETKPIAPTTSAAHIYGKRRVAAETFTSAPMNWREHPFSLKHFADRSFALGITHIVFHTYTHNPLDRKPGTSFGSTIGTPFLRGQTWWHHMPCFTDYLARCGHLLEQGRPVADVLWYLGDDLDHKPRQDSPFPSGYHFDYLNADVLLNRLTFEDDHFVIPEGTRWKVLWLAPEQCRRLTPTTLKRIKTLIQGGGIVIGQAPVINASLSGGAHADLAFENLVNELWGKDRGDRGDRKIGKGRLLWGDSLQDTLEVLGIPPDVSGTLRERWCHRRTDDTDIYFVTAGRTQPLDATLLFRAEGRPELWNPIDGSHTPAMVFDSTDAGVAIPIRLPAAGSTFVVFRRDQKADMPSISALTQISHDGSKLLDATDLDRVDTAAGFPAFGIDRYGVTQPWVDPSPQTAELDRSSENLIAYIDGIYKFTRTDGQTSSVRVSGTRSIPLQKGWSLRFPDGWETPDSIHLERIQPWSENDERAVRHFSGTATYTTSFALDDIQPNDHIQIDLGRVGNIAVVTVNGIEAGTIWSAPYRLDITDQIRTGENLLSIQVTNTWHNRLVFDSQLPVPQRKTWTIGHPSKDSPLDFSGLSRDVCLQVGKRIKIPKPGNSNPNDSARHNAGTSRHEPPKVVGVGEESGEAAERPVLSTYSATDAVTDCVRPPAGRLAIVADGNSPDPDDIGATAVIFGLLQASGLSDRLVHLSHSCDLKPTAQISAEDELRRQNVLTQICEDGLNQFGPFPNLAGIFNCRTDQQAAVDDLRDAINQSTSSDPLWIIEAGEPDIIGFAIKEAGPARRQHVHVVSHHPANDNAGDFFSWQQILDFGITEHQIGDQNVGLKTATDEWDWAKEHDNANFAWIWQQLSYAEQDGVVQFQTNHFDCSDAGMVYWWITGADRGGQKHATPIGIKTMLLRGGN
ncbi:glycosyl hydrolase [Rhodopirellula sp. SWK7]|uniref:glycosyl hydrolase n=1 Tax=Rhodopirellula sp. SWK7 TaxID=595460 RepID=UPI00118190ED|nr:glycosyl hydrolase [Rhodopirellula sp. SWK7]